MKNISYLAAASHASSVSGTTTSSLFVPTGLASLPLIDLDDYPQGLLLKVILYHPSLFKIEQDFPNVIHIQDIPHNRFFVVKPSPTDLSSTLSLIPDFVKNWRELILVLLIQKSLHKICTVLQIPDATAKTDLILGILGQCATFHDQDIVLSSDNFHITRHYLCTVQFKKSLANLNLSSEDNASMTVFIHLDNDAYGVFDGMLMNLHLSPYSACTNLTLQATVDLLIQQAIIGKSATLVPPAVDNPAISDNSPIPANSASAVAPVFSSQTVSTPVVPSSPTAPTTPINSGPVVHNSGNNIASLPGSPYTFQTCPATAPPPIDRSWVAFGAGSRSFVQTPMTPTAIHALHAQCLASLVAIIPMKLEGATWTTYHVNPNQALPFNELTNSIPSWYGMHPVYG